MTQIYFAGAEATTLSTLLEECGVKNQLISFYWIIKKDRQRYFAERVQRGREEFGMKYLLDSGAFTYRYDHLAGSTASEQMPFMKYKEAYTRFIEKYGHMFEACAELDVEGATIDGVGEIGIEDVWKWREEMTEACPNARIMPVWHHDTRTRAEWDDTCADPRYPYLGIGSGASDKFMGTYSSLIAKAHSNGKRVHGYAATKVNTQLKKLKYDSADSTSWLSAQKFGTTYIFRKGKWVVLDKFQKADRRKYRRHFTQVGVDWKLLEADKSSELRKAAVVAWRDLSKYLVKKRRALHEGMESLAVQALQVPTVKPMKKPPKAVPESTPAQTPAVDNEPALPEEWVATIPGPKQGQEHDAGLIRLIHEGLREATCRTWEVPLPDAPQEVETDDESGWRENQNHTILESGLVQLRIPGTYTGKPYTPGDCADTKVAGARSTTSKDTNTREDTTEKRALVAVGTHGTSVPRSTQPDHTSGLSRPLSNTEGTASGLPLAPIEAGAIDEAPRHQHPEFVRKVEENRTLLSLLPQLRCEVCSLGEDCPSYDEERTDCAYKDQVQAFPVRDADNLLGATEAIVDLNKARLFRAYMLESTVEGGMPSAQTTSLSETVLAQLERLREQRGEMEGRAVQVSARGPGILSRLFGLAHNPDYQEVTLRSGRYSNEDPEQYLKEPARSAKPYEAAFQDPAPRRLDVHNPNVVPAREVQTVPAESCASTENSTASTPARVVHEPPGIQGTPHKGGEDTREEGPSL